MSDEPLAQALRAFLHVSCIETLGQSDGACDACETIAWAATRVEELTQEVEGLRVALAVTPTLRRALEATA